jgi:hypothetical protein
MAAPTTSKLLTALNSSHAYHMSDQTRLPSQACTTTIERGREQSARTTYGLDIIASYLTCFSFVMTFIAILVVCCFCSIDLGVIDMFFGKKYVRRPKKDSAVVNKESYDYVILDLLESNWIPNSVRIV